MFKNKVWSSAAYTSYEKGGTTFDGILVIEKFYYFGINWTLKSILQSKHKSSLGTNSLQIQLKHFTIHAFWKVDSRIPTSFVFLRDQRGRCI